MDSEKKLTLIYLILGIITGVISSYLNTIFAIFFGIGVYIVSLSLAKKFLRTEKKFRWYLTNSLITFVLVWVVVWILLFNL